MGTGGEFINLCRQLAKPMARWWLRTGSWGLLLHLLALLADLLRRSAQSGMPLSHYVGLIPADWLSAFASISRASLQILFAVWLMAAIRSYQLGVDLRRETAAPIQPSLLVSCFAFCMLQGIIPGAYLVAVSVVTSVVLGTTNIAESAQALLAAVSGLAGYMVWIIATLILSGKPVVSWTLLLSQIGSAAIGAVFKFTPYVIVAGLPAYYLYHLTLKYGWITGLLLLVGILLAIVTCRPTLLRVLLVLFCTAALLQAVRFQATVQSPGQIPPIIRANFSPLLLQAIGTAPMTCTPAREEAVEETGYPYSLRFRYSPLLSGIPIGAWGLYLAEALNMLWVVLECLLVVLLIKLRLRNKPLHLA